VVINFNRIFAFAFGVFSLPKAVTSPALTGILSEIGEEKSSLLTKKFRCAMI
jgi:hypothetical protein